ncbi:MAG: YcnI family protein [Nocardioidaceae bacterium]
MSQHHPALRRAITVGLGAVAAVTMSLPVSASAHVRVQPGEIEGGGFSVVSLRVPNERDDASTTTLRVTLPADQPLGSVQTTPVPGWKVTTSSRTLDEPIEWFGEELDTVVSDVTWTATGRGIGPGQFQDFALSLGQLPESGSMVFNAVQTYSSGERVRWNQVSADPSVEPERPAPTLTLTAPADTAAETAATSGTDAEAESTEQTRPVAQVDTAEGSSSLPLALSGAALLVSVGAVVIAARRGRA